MTEMRHEVSFQDFPCTRLDFTRSSGLSPDKGSVEINLKDLGEIRLYPLAFRFRSTTDRGYASGLPIAEYLRIKGGTATARPPYKSRGKGLNEFGELVIQSYVDGNKSKTLTYHDIYVDTSGLEEVTDDLANVLNHDEGVVKVPLTDIRQFYAGHSPVYQRINCHLPSGKYDPDTLYFKDLNDTILWSTRRTKGVPFTAAQVFQFLFSQLPGSPVCLTNVGANLSNFQDPQDIIGEGQPAVELIQRLLDQYGLDACFQPDGAYILNRNVVAEDVGLMVPTEMGKLSDIPHIHYEKKTHGLSPRPPVVEVIGQKKITQHRVPYRAVIQDLDGVYRSLSDIEKLWKYNEGYKGSAIAWNICVSSDKSFDDVPPGGDARGDKAILYHRRRALLREQAYKVFAPIGIFTDKISPEYGGPALEGFREDDLEGMPSLPVSDCPLYKKQMKDLYKAIPTPTNVPEVDEVVWVPPIVSGSYYTQGLFKDFKAVEERFESLKDIYKEVKAEGVAAKKALKQRRSTYKKENQLWKSARQAKVWDSPLATGVRREVRGWFGMDDLTQADEFSMAQAPIRERQRRKLEKDIKFYQSWVTDSQGLIEDAKSAFASFKKVYEKFGAMWLKYNVPHQIISGGYALDRRTGILKFGEPMFIAEKPFYLDSESVRAARPANVEMFYGVESNTNTKYDYTTVQVAGDTDSDVVDVVGANVLGIIPPYIMQAPSLRFAQEMGGTPMNVETVKTAALEMAKPILSQPRDATGYEREYVGLWKIILDMGVTSVRHEFDGDTAYTKVSINTRFRNFKPKPGMVGQKIVSHIARTMGSGPHAR